MRHLAGAKRGEQKNRASMSCAFHRALERAVREFALVQFAQREGTSSLGNAALVLRGGGPTQLPSLRRSTNALGRADDGAAELVAKRTRTISATLGRTPARPRAGQGRVSLPSVAGARRSRGALRLLARGCPSRRVRAKGRALRLPLPAPRRIRTRALGGLEIEEYRRRYLQAPSVSPWD